MIVSCARCKYEGMVTLPRAKGNHYGRTTPDVWICTQCIKEVTQ